MVSDTRAYTEIFVTYILEQDGGVYDKKGCVKTQTEDEIIFETTSERYRVKNNEVIERKQRRGWHRLGTVQNIATREKTGSHITSFDS